MKYLKSAILFIGFQLFFIAQTFAQCAMCRGTVESTVSEGNIGLASKLNTGILYLFFTPYLMAALIGYLWYKKSRENARRQEIAHLRKQRIAHLGH